MFFVENHKTFPTSGHAVVTLTDDEFKYLQIYVKDIRPQVSPKDFFQCLLVGADVVWLQVL